MALIFHKVVWFRQTCDGAQLSSYSTSTSQVCMFRTDITRERSCQMAFLLYKAVCVKQPVRVSAAVKWHFYFSSVYVAQRHHARMQLSNGTSTLQVCMFQSDTTRECSCQMALLLHKSVCFKQTSRVSAYLTIPNSTSKVCMFKSDITRECSYQMALLLHKCVCFIQT